MIAAHTSEPEAAPAPSPAEETARAPTTPDVGLHAAPTNALPPADAYFVTLDVGKRGRSSVVEVYYEDGQVERFSRKWKLRCKLDATGVQKVKDAIEKSGLVSAQSTTRDRTIKDGGSLVFYFAIDGKKGEVRNPNFPAAHIPEMQRAKLAADEIVRTACP